MVSRLSTEQVTSTLTFRLADSGHKRCRTPLRLAGVAAIAIGLVLARYRYSHRMGLRPVRGVALRSLRKPSGLAVALQGRN